MPLARQCLGDSELPLYFLDAMSAMIEFKLSSMLVLKKLGAKNFTNLIP